MIEQQFHKHIRTGRKFVLWAGILLLLLGALAFLFPVAVTLAINLLLGAVIIFAGLVRLIGALSYRGAGRPFIGALIVALVAIGIGLIFLFQPVVGATALTILLAIFFLADGAFEIGLAFELKPLPRWQWILVSGLVSTGLGVFIVLGLPGTALFTLGILLGIHFVTTGLAFLLIFGALGTLGDE